MNKADKRKGFGMGDRARLAGGGEWRFMLRRRAVLPLAVATWMGRGTSWAQAPSTAPAAEPASEPSSPPKLTLTPVDMDAWVHSQLPMRGRLIEVVDIAVQSMKVGLLPDANRLSADAGLSGRERIFGRPFTGQLSFDGVPRYDAATQSVRLEDIRVGRLSLDDVPPHVQSAVRGAGPVLVEQLLKERIVYRFRPEDLQRAADLGLQPQAVKVTPRGVELTLVARL